MPNPYYIHQVRGLIVCCQRCFNGEEAHYRVQSEVMNIAVCDGCAEEARRLGLATEIFHSFAYVPDDEKLAARIRDQAQ